MDKILEVLLEVWDNLVALFLKLFDEKTGIKEEVVEP